MTENSETPFAGLLRLAPGEPLSAEGFKFQFIDPLIIDRLLKIGAITHKHNAATALADPTVAPTFTSEASGGSVPASTTVQTTYTTIDAHGGETLPAPAAVLTTAASFPDPQEVPSVAVSTAAGALLAANYVYGVTVTDGEGGESALSPLAEAVVPPGFPNAEVTVSELKTILTEVAGATVGAEWRLWRRQNGGEWNLIDHGTGETVVDNGTLVPDCTVQPPNVSTTKSANKLLVEVPKLDAGVEFFRVYLTTAGSFGPTSLVAEYPASEAEKEIELASLSVLPGAPPSVSRAIAGANKIDPDTDLLDWHWKRPVKKASELPTEGNEEGDVRLDLETLFFYIWNGEWKIQKVETEAHHWLAPVKKASELPSVGNVEGDVRLVEETKKLYSWDDESKEWVGPPTQHVHTMESHTWAVAGAVTGGVIPGPFVLTATDETQHLLSIEADIGAGECTITLLHNGAAIGELTTIALTGGVVAITLVAPLELKSKDKLSLEIVSSEGGEGLNLTAFVEHVGTVA